MSWGTVKGNLNIHAIFSFCHKRINFPLCLHWHASGQSYEDSGGLENDPVGNSDTVSTHGTGLSGFAKAGLWHSLVRCLTLDRLFKPRFFFYGFHFSGHARCNF